MGLFSFAKKKIVKQISKVGIVVAGSALGEVWEQADTKRKKRIKNEFLSDKSITHTRLVVSQNIYKLKEDFKIYDQNQNLKYIVRGKILSLMHNLSIYDATGKIKLGQVIQKIISLRMPYTFESHPQDFVLFLKGRRIGKIKSRFSIGYHKYKCNFNNWIIEGNFIGNVYKVRDKKRVIMRVEEKVVLHEDLYFLDIFSMEDEVLCLLIALAIDSVKTSKVHDDDRTIRRRLGNMI